MKRSISSMLALALSIALLASTLPISSILSVRAEAANLMVKEADTAEGGHDVSSQAPERSPEDEPSAEPTKAPTTSPTDEASTASPTDEASTASPTDEPGEVPTQSPTELPGQEPSVEPSASPTAMSTEVPTIAPGETPAPSIYQVSPAEVTYFIGSQAVLTFSISPAGAPFIGVEGIESNHADGVITIGPEALSALAEGEHTLAFLFADGARIEVKLTVAAAKLAAKGPVNSLEIGGKIFHTDELASDRKDESQHWAWDAETATLTLSGYNGSQICYYGEQTLTVCLLPGSVNTISSSDVDGSLYSDFRLVLSGSGTLNVSNNAESAIASEEELIVNGGMINASGKKRAFYSMDAIRLNGGTIEVKHINHQGIGFSAASSTRIDGATVTVEGAGTAFGSLGVNSGEVTIRDCETGVGGGLSASGGVVTIENTVRNAAESAYGMSFSNCSLTIRGCGQYGLYPSQDLTIGSGANIRIEAKQIALYAPGRGARLKIEKGANLDLNGGESAIKGNEVLIGGKRYTGTSNHVVIQNGTITKQENTIFAMAVGGEEFGAASLSGDLSGSGWAWIAATKMLTLNGYDAGAVTAIGGAVTLSLRGENVIGGDLTVSSALVTGGGTLTVQRIVGKAGLTIESGTANATRLILDGGLTILGGAVNLSGDDSGPVVVCANFDMKGGALTLFGGNGSLLTGIRPTGKATISGGTVTVKKSGDFLYAKGDVTISGGSISIGDDTDSGIGSDKNIMVAGGNIQIKAAHYALKAENGAIVLSGRPSLRLESTMDAAFFAKTVKIAGKVYAPRYSGVVIENGKLTDEYKMLPDLIIEGVSYFMKDLNEDDLSGDGWFWSAKKNALTLSGYSGKGIWINRPMTVALASGTSNRGGDDYNFSDAAIYAQENLTLTGTGRWSGGLYCAKKLTISGSPNISASAIQSYEGEISITGGRISVSGKLKAEIGRISIQNATVTAGRVYGSFVSIRNGSVSTTTKGDEDYPDLGGNSSLDISGSIVFCTEYGSPHGKVSLSGSPIFCRAEDEDREEIWVLVNNATISRDMTLPLGKDCYVPVWSMLTIAKGKKLYAYGSFVVDGRVKGTVVTRREADKIEVYGSAQVARGKSVTLTAQVVPVLPDGQADQAISWTSSKPWLLPVSDKGVVTATALARVGDTADITCAALDGSFVEAIVPMMVTEPVTKITILSVGAAVSRMSASRSAGAVELDARIDPVGSGNRVKWTSSNTAIASVDPDEGTVQLRKKGAVTITCAAMDGTGVKATVKLTIK